MTDAYAKDYGTCSFCGAKKVLNPRTGKIFCEDKCWLKNKPAEAYSPEQARSVEIKQFQESKGESMRLMSSGRDAVLITVAEMAQEGGWSETKITEHLEKWRKYFYDNIYVDRPF